MASFFSFPSVVPQQDEERKERHQLNTPNPPINPLPRPQSGTEPCSDACCAIIIYPLGAGFLLDSPQEFAGLVGTGGHAEAHAYNNFLFNEQLP